MSANLYEQWTTLDDRQLAKNPVSIRLPIHVVARLSALGELFPTRTRSEFIIDMLKAGLQGLEDSMPVKDFPEFPSDEPPSAHHALGQEYRRMANQHYRKLVKDTGGKNLTNLFPMTEKEKSK